MFEHLFRLRIMRLRLQFVQRKVHHITMMQLLGRHIAAEFQPEVVIRLVPVTCARARSIAKTPLYTI